ncbi:MULTISPECIES: hypothetical protein [unclassified Rhizobium]|uniref:competence protein CoiA n=1 Tax=Rhizobium sp. BK313 TaxID=2587081 RepID=UPI001AAC4675
MCGSAVVAKCGPRVVHHWAHKGRRNCDPWWENETEWHRQWKNHFPEECREISHIAEDGEIHRSDIKTPHGVYIEVQHSAMTDAERKSREEFYKNLIWVIDGQPFKKNFAFITCCLIPRRKWLRTLSGRKLRATCMAQTPGFSFGYPSTGSTILPSPSQHPWRIYRGD